MTRVKDILAAKGNHVMTVGPDATVLDAATIMNDQKIGSLVVLDGGRVIGMFTERDVLVRIVAERRDPAETRVRDAMTPEVVCCTPETTAEEAACAMKNRRIRHLPVVCEDGTICGMVSIGDLNARQCSEQEQTIYHLQEYLYGRV
jgi:CBS domain-containing protein